MNEHVRDLAKEVIDTAHERGLTTVPLAVKTHLVERLQHFELRPESDVLVASLSAFAEVIKACRQFGETEACDEMSGKAALRLTQNTVLMFALAAAERVIEVPEPEGGGAYI